MLHRGEALAAVLASVLGTCSAGRAAQATFLQRLADAAPTLRVRRRLLEHWLRTFERATQHGSQWRVIGADAFVGRQHGPLELTERFDLETGEVHHTSKRRYCPAARAGGLSAHSDRSPRTLHTYRGRLRTAQLMGSKQPPYNASDAKRPRNPDGQWAYAQHWLTFAPPPALLARWRGSKRKPKVRATRLPERSYSAAQPPRVDDLRALGAYAERSN
jgi:hypothetical protein